VAAPALDDDLRLGEAVEDLPVQQFIAELGVEALAVAVLTLSRASKYLARALATIVRGQPATGPRAASNATTAGAVQKPRCTV
jgi:hypothetical protein